MFLIRSRERIEIRIRVRVIILLRFWLRLAFIIGAAVAGAHEEFVRKNR